MEAALPFCVGLTGGIGSGKSTVARLFAERGVSLIDTDLIAHALTAPGGEAIGALKDAFGPDILGPDGALDRARMRQLVFADPRQKMRLEAILHPLIRQRAQIELEEARGCYAMLVVPLLAENPHYRQHCQRILLVECPEELQIQRVMARSKLSEDEVRTIIASQASPEARREIADERIDNAGGLATLEHEVASLHQKYLALAAGLLDLHV